MVNSTSRMSGTSASPSVDQVFHLLTHPKRVPLSSDEESAIGGASSLHVMHNDAKLAVYSWGYGPTVLLLHGWESHSGHMLHFVPPLVKAGFKVLSFDAPCHGQSEGKCTDAVDYGRSVLSVVRSVGMPVAIIGHSVGSAAALYAFSHGVSVQASVHISGPTSMERVLKRGCSLAGLNEDATGQVLQRMSAQIGEPLAVMDLPLLLRGLVHPALIFHDAQDLEIPFSDSVELAQAWTNSRLETVTNLGHRRILRSPFILEQSVNFVAQMIKG